MSTTQANKIDIIKNPLLKIKEVDFENLSFGSVFTDHLMECDFTNGEWQNQSSNLIHHFCWIHQLEFSLWPSNL
jgi:hypothetical protein